MIYYFILYIILNIIYYFIYYIFYYIHAVIAGKIIDFHRTPWRHDLAISM